MTLLSPAFLWILAALLPLGMIYLIRVRPRRKTTTAFFLWEKVMPETRPNRLFQNLRDLFSLLLLAVAVAALALGLAEPRLGGEDERNLVLIIDTSASMSREEKGGKTRLDLAREAAVAWVRDLRGGRQAMLAAADGRVRQLARLTAHPPALLRALEDVQGSALPLDTGGLAAFVTSALESGGSRVLFFTDGCASEMELLPAGLEMHLTGPVAPASRPNAALVAADLQPSPETTGALTALARLRHDFPRVAPARLEISRLSEEGEPALQKVVPVRLDPGELEQRLITELPAPEPGEAGERWRFELLMDAAPDALRLDDRAEVVLPAPRPVRVAVLGDEPFFPVLAVRAFEQSRHGLEWVEDLDRADLALIIGQATQAELAALPPGAGRIVIRPEGESPWWQGSVSAPDGHEAAPVAVIEQPEHPLLRFFDAEGIDYRGARPGLRMPDGASLLVAGESGGGRLPLLYWVSQPESRTLVLNLDPVASAFYLSPAFPVLVRNAALALTRREDRLPGQLRLGQWVSLPPGAGEGMSLVLNLPNGNTRALEPGQGWLVDQSGFYALPALGWQGAAALFNPDESFAPDPLSSDAPPPAPAVLAAAPAGVGGRPWSWWLGLAALSLITVESLLYHRRRVG
jgi:hypothetical protein